MQMARLCLCIVTFYSSVMVLDSVDVDRVGPMNELLSNSSWLELGSKFEPSRVISRWMETEEHCYARQLLERSPNGHIVNDDNVNCKIGLAHDFLSCQYADDLKKYCELKRGIVHQCGRVETTSDALEWFQTFLEDLIQDNNRMVSRMRGALFCFYELSPRTVLNRDVFQILEKFKIYCNAIRLPEATSSETISSVLEAQIGDIENYMFDTVELLSKFFNSNCRPIPYEEEHGNGVSSTRGDVEAWTDVYDFKYAMYCMKEKVDQIIDAFIKAGYELLGFKYNAESSSTRIDYDPETIPRVNQINALLSFTGWSRTETSKIYEGDWGRRVDRLLYSSDGPLVNKKNLAEKLRQVHQILSCEYIIVIKTCHDLLLGIANECSKNFNADCWKNFWIIVKQMDPMVVRMRGSLFYFYQLSPRTEYLKGVYEILGELKNHYDSVDMSDSLLSKTKHLIAMKLWKMDSLTKKIDPLFEFFKPNCWTTPPLFSRPPPEDSGLPLPRRSEDFNGFIRRFIDITYGSFGFTYNLESDTTTIIRN